MKAIGVDTSVAVPLLVQTHSAHIEVVQWWSGREIAMSGHALAETYSVLTRLPGDIRLSPEDAARLLASRFDLPLLPNRETSVNIPSVLARSGVSGGAVYDALIGLAAMENDSPLATRDRRAVATYEAVGAKVIFVG